MKKLITILILIFPNVLAAQNDSLRLAQVDFLNKVRTNPYAYSFEYHIPRGGVVKPDSILMAIAQRRVESIFKNRRTLSGHPGYDRAVYEYSKQVGNDMASFEECLGSSMYEIEDFLDSQEHSQILTNPSHKNIGLGIVMYDGNYYICVVLN